MDNDDILDYLIQNGAIEIAAVDENGELLYAFTPKLKTFLPELYHEHLNKVNKDVAHFWELGFLNVDWFSDSPIVTLTEKAFNQKEIAKLSLDDRYIITEIKRVLTEKP